MKKYKFNIIYFLLILLLLSIFVIFKQKNNYSLSNFLVEGNKIINVKNNTDFQIKGIVYSPYYPGEKGGDELKNDNRYFDHLNKIKELGANSITVFPQKMPSNFYLALENNDLYYSQVIDINLYDGTSNKDLLSEEYQEKVLDHVREVIDSNYQSASIDRLMYYIIGYEINPSYIEYTNNYYKEVKDYNGKYVKLENRSASEIALALILDKSIEYEVQKYNRRSLYSHNSFPAYNLLNNNKYFYPDFFDILSVNIYPSFFYDKDDYYLLENERDENNGFYNYIYNLLNKTNIPVLISELGLSSVSANSNIPAYGDNSEEAVADLYKRSWQDIKRAEYEINKDIKISGVYYFEFLDEFWKNGEEENDENIHNILDSEEWFGIYSIKDNLDNDKLEAKEKIINELKLIFK